MFVKTVEGTKTINLLNVKVIEFIKCSGSFQFGFMHPAGVVADGMTVYESRVGVRRAQRGGYEYVPYENEKENNKDAKDWYDRTISALQKGATVGSVSKGNDKKAEPHSYDRS